MLTLFLRGTYIFDNLYLVLSMKFFKCYESLIIKPVIDLINNVMIFQLLSSIKISPTFCKPD